MGPSLQTNTAVGDRVTSALHHWTEDHHHERLASAGEMHRRAGRPEATSLETKTHAPTPAAATSMGGRSSSTAVVSATEHSSSSSDVAMLPTAPSRVSSGWSTSVTMFLWGTLFGMVVSIWVYWCTYPAWTYVTSANRRKRWSEHRLSNCPHASDCERRHRPHGDGWKTAPSYTG